LLLALSVAFVAACGDDPVAPKNSGGIASPADVVAGLERFYRARDYESFVSLLANDAANAAQYVYVPPIRTIERSWGTWDETQIHRRMFDPGNTAPGEPAVPAEYWLERVDISLQRFTEWEEQPDLYRSGTNPRGLPPEKWKAVAARFATHVFFGTRTENDFLVEGEAVFTVIEDLEKTGSEPGRFLLLKWEDVDLEPPIAAVDSKNWTDVKMLYRAVLAPEAPGDVIDRLESAYHPRDRTAFASLLANDSEHAAEYLFRLAGAPSGELSWGYNEEARIHRRMFEPHNVGPGEPEVPTEYWLQAIQISLNQVTPWLERADLYRSEANPTGLAPEKWKAVDARYSTHVFFDTQTDIDFLVEGEAIFVVIEDLEKSGAEPGRFLLLEWQDIDVSGPLEKEQKTWSGIKDLYR
jgi:hypothetical protein